MMDAGVVQHHHDTLVAVMGHNLLQKGHEFLRVIWCRATPYLSGFIVQHVQELGSPNVFRTWG